MFFSSLSIILTNTILERIQIRTSQMNRWEDPKYEASMSSRTLHTPSTWMCDQESSLEFWESWVSIGVLFHEPDCLNHWPRDRTKSLVLSLVGGLADTTSSEHQSSNHLVGFSGVASPIYLISINYHVWSEDPTMNDKDIPITQESPSV